MTELKVQGKIIIKPEPHFHIGSPVPVELNTHTVKLYDQESKGLRKLWEAIVGYSKREMLVQDGHIFLLEKRGNGQVVQNAIPLWELFKLFVDPEDEKIRLVLNSENRLINIDMQPDNFILIVGMINH